jgi:hypothetical protein
MSGELKRITSEPPGFSRGEVQHILSAADIGKLRAAGFAVVPREATEAMANAGVEQLYSAGDASMGAAYRAMVEAAEAELIHAHTTQALEHLAQIGAVPTMGADEVLKLTRG